MDLSKKMPLPQALAWIVGSTFLFTGSSYSLWRYHLQEKQVHLSKQEDVIKKIIQTGPHRDHLSTQYLAYFLELFVDQPKQRKSIHVKDEEKKLLSLPMVKEAHISVLVPDTLYIDYTMREPFAFIDDYENLAVDENGYLFPFAPFYSPKKLPQIFLGKTLINLEESLFFKEPLQEPSFLLGVEILRALQSIALQEGFFVKKIDLSRYSEKSLGQQEIIIEIASEDYDDSDQNPTGHLHYLRVSPQHYAAQLGNYIILRKELMAYSKQEEKNPLEKKMIDLRVLGSAFIEDLQS